MFQSKVLSVCFVTSTCLVYRNGNCFYTLKIYIFISVKFMWKQSSQRLLSDCEDEQQLDNKIQYKTQFIRATNYLNPKHPDCQVTRSLKIFQFCSQCLYNEINMLEDLLSTSPRCDNRLACIPSFVIHNIVPVSRIVVLVQYSACIVIQYHVLNPKF